MLQKHRTPVTSIYHEPPLVFDLDGTLIYTDTLHEMLALVVRQKPWLVFKLPFWFLKGRPFVKARLLEEIDLNPATLPYNSEILALARAQAKQKRLLVLATGTPQVLAEKIASHVGLFPHVIGTNEQVNMTGHHKRQALVERFGERGFDYVGDSRIDAHVWAVSRQAIVTHPKRGVLKRALAIHEAENVQHFPRTTSRWKAVVMSLRPAFWLWGLCTLSPMLFLSLALFTSGIFILGDVLWLEKERKNGAASRWSAFAAGHLHLTTAFALAPLFLLLSFSLTPRLLLYAPFLIAADWSTRLSPPLLRWLFLSLMYLLGLLVLTA